MLATRDMLQNLDESLRAVAVFKFILSLGVQSKGDQSSESHHFIKSLKEMLHLCPKYFEQNCYVPDYFIPVEQN